MLDVFFRVFYQLNEVFAVASYWEDIFLIIMNIVLVDHSAKVHGHIEVRLILN